MRSEIVVIALAAAMPACGPVCLENCFGGAPVDSGGESVTPLLGPSSGQGLSCTGKAQAATGNGWTFFGAAPSAACAPGYMLLTSGDPSNGGNVLVSGDTGGLCQAPDGVSGGLQRTFSITPGSFGLSFSFDATSSGTLKTTGAEVRVIDAATGHVVYSESGSYVVTDTGTLAYAGDFSAYVQGLSQVTVVLGLHDAWDTNWAERDTFSKIVATTCVPSTDAGTD
jgi:hypothetical protein